MPYIGPFRQVLICILAICVTHLTSISPEVSAQTAPITSSGLNTQISAPIQVDGQTQYNITGGTRPEGGANLFHSFGEFGILNNNIANFVNGGSIDLNGAPLPAGLTTDNILGRVTGGNESHILGTLRTSESFGSANLFLMNPSGFLFGPNATVNIGGMVSFTSADYLKLEDGKTFTAIPNPATDALLSASPVAAFGFLGSNAASIAIQGGAIEVAEGKTLSFIGGPRVFTTASGVTVPSGVSMSQGSLSAPNGLIYMATVDSPGEILVPILSGSPLATPGLPSSSPTIIRIRSGEFVMDRSSLKVTNASNAAQPPIEVTVQGVMELKNASSINTSATPSSAGRGGDIVVQARQAYLHEFSTIRSDTAGQSDAGAITIQATDLISLVDSSLVSNATTTGPPSAAKGGPIRLHAPNIEAKGSQLLSTTDGLGNAGNILIETEGLTITDVGVLNDFSIFSTRTEGPGQAGQITIRGMNGPGSYAQDIMLTGNSQIVSETVSSVFAVGGNAGSVTINTARLSLGKSSGISTTSSGTASSGLSHGNSGNITVNASDSVTVSGGLITTSTGTSGRGGTITLNTGILNLTDGGRLTSSSFLSAPAGAVTIQGVHGQGSMANSVVINGKGESGNTSGIFTHTEGSGSGGNISMNAGSITLQNSGMLSAETLGTAASAIGGTITVNANTVQLNSGATITANSNGVADAGNISITATDGLTMQNSLITTLVHPNNNGSNAGGGDIKITTSPAATVYLHNSSTISASVADGAGGGGNVTIDPQYVILQGSRILAQTDQGTGGNITIIANVFQPDATSIVNADAGRGVNGTVTIQSPNAPASGKIQPLGNRPLQATALLTQRCAAMVDGRFSSFAVVSRDALPTDPGGWLPSPLPIAFPKSHGGTITDTGLRVRLGKPMGELPILSLRQIAPPGFLTKAFAVGQTANCIS